MNSGSASGNGEGIASVSRELWGAILAALDCDDRVVRQEVYAAVMAVGAVAWDEDLDTPGVLEQHLRAVGAHPGTNGRGRAEVVSLRWAAVRPRISPGGPQ